MEEQHTYLHALRSIPRMTDKGLRKILFSFKNDPRKAWESGPLPSSLLLGTTLNKRWQEKYSLIPDIFAHANILEQQNIYIITETDFRYPPLLKETPDHPYFLYIRGELPSPKQPLLAVVGSRKFTAYGKQACESLIKELNTAGIGIVSGLALGIDKIAHQTSTDSGYPTWAVLGSGVDDAGITPFSHQQLGKEIIKKGALLSEFPPGTVPKPENFPQRNRIIAGMTLGTLVIEAAERSGSLITARLALEYDREVFAVPGSIFSEVSQGTNTLLKSGAIPVTNAKDIINILFPENSLF